MWKTKLWKQVGVCLIIVLAFALAQSIGVPQMNRGSEAVIAYLSKHYTAGDAMAFAKNSAQAVVQAPVALTNAILSSRESSEYAEPIDDAEEGQTISVYAMEAGTVSAVGKNDKIGQFVKIVRGDGKESVYGNCSKVYVKELQRIKKGQVIASFTKEENLEFYHSVT